jgi:hypothetical protein
MTVVKRIYATFVILHSLVFIYGPIHLLSLPPFLMLTVLEIQMIGNSRLDMLYSLDQT